MGLNATDPAHAALNNDEDGLSNYEEYINGSFPNEPDSDHDRWRDKNDFTPLNPIQPWLFYDVCFLVLSGLGLVGFFEYRHIKLQK
jgi:hypothetical protein